MSSKDSDVLAELPYVKPSYEVVAHKKVYNSDLYAALPAGQPCLVWFTMMGDQCVCSLIELDDRQQPVKSRSVFACFASQLCYGTLARGTLFRHFGQEFVCLDDLLYYKNQKMDHEPWLVKYSRLAIMTKRDMVQHAYNPKFVVFGLPLLASSNEELERSMALVTYPLHQVKCYKRNSCLTVAIDIFLKTLALPKFQTQSLETLALPKTHLPAASFSTRDGVVLLVKPDLQNDVYHVYSRENTLCGVACVPDFQTSKQLNALFRTIKENDDLDKLEESDDEVEFEDAREDKFVFLDRAVTMVCRYHKRFKKWTPLRVESSRPLSTLAEVHAFLQALVPYKQPNAHYKQPNASYKQPNASYKQPNASYKQPNAPYKQPNAHYKQPNASYKQHGYGYPRKHSKR